MSFKRQKKSQIRDKFRILIAKIIHKVYFLKSNAMHKQIPNEHKENLKKLENNFGDHVICLI